MIKLQKRAIRIISSAHIIAHTELLFKSTKILTISKIYVYCAQLFMFQYRHGTTPSIFDSFYKLNNEIHEHNTRQRNSIHNIGTNTSQGCKSLRKTGVKLYNHFKNILNMDCSITTYKKHLKMYLIENDITDIDIN